MYTNTKQCILKGELFMKKENIKIKQVGNFIISYYSLKEVALSWKGIAGCISTQLVTNEKVKGILTHTGTFCDLPFEGCIYPGIIFNKPVFMSRRKLERILMNTK